MPSTRFIDVGLRQLAYAAPLVALLTIGPARVSAEPAPETGAMDFSAAAEILQHACSDCHSGGAAEGGFSLEQIAAQASLKDHFERWQTIRRRVSERSMPPADAEPLPDDVREALAIWIEAASIAAVCGDGPSAGPPLLRRLARHEYSNTIRDLLDIHFDAGQVLPEDAAGGEGFSNTAETLTISPIHAEKYLQAATDALDYAARDSRARRRLLRARPHVSEPEDESAAEGEPRAEGRSAGAPDSPPDESLPEDRSRREDRSLPKGDSLPAGDSLAEDDAARENLRALAERAFRRPVSEDSIEACVAVFRAARADGLPFDEAVLYAMRGILIAPSFLFISESPPAERGVAEPLSDHELAVRLSYFLWASTPDEQLREAADEGRLQEDDELKRQTLRLLTARGTHLQDAMEHFVGSWLGTADLGRSRQVDRARHRWIEDPHVAALRNQPVYAMTWILRENEPILELLDADWTFLNNELVRVYRIRKSRIEERFVQRLERVKLPEEYRYRGGLLGMGGVMAVSSYPRRSSPVLRGAWVLEKLLGVELPPPPPDVPALDESEQAVETHTLRERLEQHRRDPACAGCHDRVDPIGFALENFDELGRWREEDEGGPIDPAARLPDGTQIEGVAGLKRHLLDRRETFARVLTRKMLGYALGRSLRPGDLCTVKAVVRRLKENEYRSHELVLGIVMSEPFRRKMLTEERGR